MNTPSQEVCKQRPGSEAWWQCPRRYFSTGLSNLQTWRQDVPRPTSWHDAAHLCVLGVGGGVHVPLTFWWGQETGEHLTEGCRKLHWPGERWTFGIPGLRSELGRDKGCHSLWGGRGKGKEGTQRDLREVEGRDPRPRPVLGQ